MQRLPRPWNKSLRHQDIDALPILADWLGEHGMNSEEEFTRLLHLAMDDGPAFYDIRYASPERSSEPVRARMCWRGRTHSVGVKLRASCSPYYCTTYHRRGTYSANWTLASVWPHAYVRYRQFSERIQLLLARDLLWERALEADRRLGAGWANPWKFNGPVLICYMSYERLAFWHGVIDYLEGKTTERPR